jgi:hypothetical protein
VAAAGAMLALVTLVGCGVEETPQASDASTTPAATVTPAVCSSIDALKSSVADLQNVDVAKGSLATLQDMVMKVLADLTKVLNDAKSEYATEVKAVDSATATVSTSLKAATATPSERTLSTVRTAVQTLGTSLRALENAVRSTC